MMKPKASTSDCPCRARDEQPMAYAQCCQPWHIGWSQGVYADTPEQLMRSRYSAYALAVGNNPQGHAMLAYLLSTWHVSTVPDGLELSPIQWVGLQVLHAQASQDAGVVEFVAHYKESGKAHKMHEVSRFVRNDGAAHWLYVDGLVQEG